MAVYYPLTDITKTTAATSGIVLATGSQNDMVMIKSDIEVAATGTGASHGIYGVNNQNADITVAGLVYSAYGNGIDLGMSGVSSGATNCDIHVAETGLVVGQYGINVVGAGTNITNYGEIRGMSGWAINLTCVNGWQSSVDNAGVIDGAINGTTNGLPATLAVTNSGVINGSVQAGSNIILDLHNTGRIAGPVYGTDYQMNITNAGEIGYISMSGGWSTPNASISIHNSGTIGELNGYSINGNTNGTCYITNTGTIAGVSMLGNGNDLYDGTAGRALGAVMSGGGQDTLLGGDGVDRLYGGDGDDEIDAGAGADVVTGGAGADIMDGGDGIDTLSYEFSWIGQTPTSGVNVNLGTGEAFGGDAEGDLFSNFERVQGSGWADTLTGSAANDTLAGAEGNDLIAGGAGRDLLQGGAGADTLDGQDGADLLRGGADADLLLGNAGADTLRGEAGNDTLQGGGGADWLFGGTGADTFRFAATADSGIAATTRDRILDFSHAQGDVIDLSLIDANGGGAGNGVFDFIEGSAFSGVAGQLRQSALANGNTLLSGDLNGDKVADFTIEVRGAITFVDADFVL